MHQPSGRHRRPRHTLAGRAWAVAAALLAAALTFVFVPPARGRERTALPSAPVPPRLPAAPVPSASSEPMPEPTRPAHGPGDFPDRRAWAVSARDTSTRWANGYREAAPDENENAGPLARPYMPPRPRPRPLVPRPRMPEGDLLAAPPGTADDLGDLAAVIRTYLAVIG